MKKILLSMACLMAVLALSAQSTAKKFVLNLTADGESNLTCYLPQNPSGRAVVDCPGGGYSHLASIMRDTTGLSISTSRA